VELPQTTKTDSTSAGKLKTAIESKNIQNAYGFWQEDDGLFLKLQRKTVSAITGDLVLKADVASNWNNSLYFAFGPNPKTPNPTSLWC
jgi:hypothetical protein